MKNTNIIRNKTQTLPKLLLAIVIVAGLFGFGFHHPEEAAKEFGQTFVTAFVKNDFKSIRAMMPGPSEWRELAPEQTAGMNDEAIMAKAGEGNAARLKDAFNLLIQDAKKRKLDRKELEFKDVVIQRKSPEPSDPVVMEIMFYYGYAYGRFSVGAVKLNDKWHLLEIVDTEQTFGFVK